MDWAAFATHVRNFERVEIKDPFSSRCSATKSMQLARSMPHLTAKTSWPFVKQILAHALKPDDRFSSTIINNLGGHTGNARHASRRPLVPAIDRSLQSWRPARRLGKRIDILLTAFMPNKTLISFKTKRNRPKVNLKHLCQEDLDFRQLLQAAQGPYRHARSVSPTRVFLVSSTGVDAFPDSSVRLEFQHRL
jgi:hypothetical protein